MFTNLLKRWAFIYFNTCSFGISCNYYKDKTRFTYRKTMQIKEKITMLTLIYFPNF